MTDTLEDHEGTVSIGGRTITNLCFADDIDGLAGEEAELANLEEELANLAEHFISLLLREVYRTAISVSHKMLSEHLISLLLRCLS